MIQTTQHQLQLLQHTLGVRVDQRTPYRNYFVADPGHHDMPDLEALEHLGLMGHHRAPSFCDPSDIVFYTTDTGRALALEMLPEPPPPPKHSQHREWMFGAACDALGQISDHLGIDSDINPGAEPIIEAIDELRAGATTQPQTYPVLDGQWRRHMLDGTVLVRDEMGCGDHPALPMLKEDMNPLQFFGALGIELTGRMAESEMDSDAYDAMIEACDSRVWTPTTPDGEGWVLVSIFENEDGPVAWWIREAVPVKPERKNRKGADPAQEHATQLAGQPVGHLRNENLGKASLDPLFLCGAATPPNGRYGATYRPVFDAAPAQSQEDARDSSRFLSETDYDDLSRFDGMASDGEGYDISKDRMKRLAELGVVRWLGRDRYGVTAFGQYVLKAWGELPLETYAETNARCDAEFKARIERLNAEAIAARAAQGGA